MEKKVDFPVSSNLPCLLSFGRQCDTRTTEACPGRRRKYWGNGIRYDKPYSASVPGASPIRGGKQNTVATVPWYFGMRGRESCKSVSHDEDPNAIFPFATDLRGLGLGPRNLLEAL